MNLEPRDSLPPEAVSITPLEGTVPDVVGMGLKDAIYLLEKSGLVVSFSGVGVVQSQSFKPGTRVSRGSLISLRLGIPDASE